MCDKEVTDVLSGLVQPPNFDALDLDRTVVICSTRKECDVVNDHCINRIDRNEGVNEALDTDHHGHPLREADKDTVLKYRESCLLYTSPSPRDATLSRMPSSA